MKERFALVVIIGVFLAASIYPILRERPYGDFAVVEIVQIRKMLDYGFARTHGVVPHNKDTTGRLAHPEKFNYTHHPLPRNWLYAGLYRLWGAFGVMTFNVVLGLVESLLVYAALRRQFDVVPSLIPAALYACTPALQFWAVGPTSIVLMVLLWPLAAWLIWPAKGRSQPAPGTWFWLGLTVFLAGQVSWSMLAAVPSLLLMSARAGADWKDTIRQNFRNRLWWAIILGAALSALAFLTQVIIYSPRLSEPFQHAALLVTAGDRKRLLIALLLRTVVLVSPALVFGSLMGIRMLTRPQRLTLGAAAMIACGLLLLFGAALLPLFFTEEKWLLAWLLFPAAYLTACWLATTRTRAAAGWLIVLAIPGVLYVQASASMPKLSRATQMLARYLGEQTNPQDLILTDLQWQAFPFRYWDQFGINWLADRLAFYGINSVKELEVERERHRGQVARTLYLHQSSGKADGDLLHKVLREGRLLDRRDLPIPAEVEKVSRLLRPIYWWRQQTGHGALGKDDLGGPTNQVVSLELYQLE